MTAPVVPALTDYTAKVKHDGVIHELRLHNLEIPRCQTCGETIVTMEVDDRINEELRSRLQLLTPMQIHSAIDTLGFTHEDVAKRLGVAADTVARWENGSLIQSRAMDNLMRLFFAFPEVRNALRGPAQDPQLGVTLPQAV
jgi:putative zinc finger/helix-turn-helix YgiT family protein